MSILNFEQPEKPKSSSSKPSKFMVAIGIALILFGLRSTFASSINLNSGGPIEFGQGKIITSACDSEILMTPNSTFINAVGGGEYRFTSLTFSDINSDSSHCSNKTFTIKAQGDGGASTLSFVGTTSEIIVKDTGSNFVLTPATGVSISQVTGDVSTFTLLFNSENSPMLSEDLAQITIESKDPPAEITYSLNAEDFGCIKGAFDLKILNTLLLLELQISLLLKDLIDFDLAFLHEKKTFLLFEKNFFTFFF
jgi:hypothetical protein